MTFIKCNQWKWGYGRFPPLNADKCTINIYSLISWSKSCAKFIQLYGPTGPRNRCPYNERFVWDITHIRYRPTVQNHVGLCSSKLCFFSTNRLNDLPIITSVRILTTVIQKIKSYHVVTIIAPGFQKLQTHSTWQTYSLRAQGIDLFLQRVGERDYSAAGKIERSIVIKRAAVNNTTSLSDDQGASRNVPRVRPTFVKHVDSASSQVWEIESARTHHSDTLGLVH